MFPGNRALVVPFTTGPRGDEHFRGFGPESVWRKPGSELHVDLREETSFFKLPSTDRIRSGWLGRTGRPPGRAGRFSFGVLINFP